MVVSGLGLSGTKVAGSTAVANTNPVKNFSQIILSALGSQPPQSKGNNAQLDIQGQSKASGLLAYLNLADLNTIPGGGELLQQLFANPNADLLQMAKDFLGINEQKWTEILARFGAEPKEKAADGVDLLEAILAGLAAMPANQLLSALNENTQLIVKTAKLMDLLAAAEKNGTELPSLPSFLEKITEKIQNFPAIDPAERRKQYLQQTFSKTAEMINQASGADSKTVSLDQKTGKVQPDWNGNPFGASVLIKPQLTLAQAGLPTKPISADDLQQQFQAILAKSQFLKKDGLQKLFIKLYPEQLGSVRIELTQKDQIIVAKILTSTNLAKDALESNVNGLKQAFAAQNIPIDRIEIAQQASFPERSLKEGHEQGDNQPQQDRQNQQQRETSEEEDGFTLSLETALLNMKV
ncbi:flagellar hook-length control protein FliK [Neobacillus sp. SM06]|uniref:flagellar hook-length control protein FliK n=1 Tax=Neobacillus sp. SM06 TaxID=3422492 RepID=UPI003D274A84